MFRFTGLKRPRLFGRANARTTSVAPSSSFFPLLHSLSVGSGMSWNGLEWSGMAWNGLECPFGHVGPAVLPVSPPKFPLSALATVAAQKSEKGYIPWCQPCSARTEPSPLSPCFQTTSFFPLLPNHSPLRGERNPPAPGSTMG